MDWWQCVDLLLLLFASALLSVAATYQRLAHFLDLIVVFVQLILTGYQTKRTTDYGRLANIRGGLHCVPLWLVWKRLNIALNYTMKPGFLLTFLLAGSTIVHACESWKCVSSFACAVYIFTLFFFSFAVWHSLFIFLFEHFLEKLGDVFLRPFEMCSCVCVFVKVSYVIYIYACLTIRCGMLYLSVGFSDWKSNSIDARQ